MALIMQQRKYDPPLGLTVQFYSNTNSVIRHLYKHTFEMGEREIWKRLLPFKEKEFKLLSKKNIYVIRARTSILTKRKLLKLYSTVTILWLILLIQKFLGL